MHNQSTLLADNAQGLITTNQTKPRPVASVAPSPHFFSKKITYSFSLGPPPPHAPQHLGLHFGSKKDRITWLILENYRYFTGLFRTEVKPYPQHPPFGYVAAPTSGSGGPWGWLPCPSCPCLRRGGGGGKKGKFYETKTPPPKINSAKHLWNTRRLKLWKK